MPDLAFDLAAGGAGGAGGGLAAYYHGYDTVSVQWSSSIWLGIAAALTTLVDASQERIARAGSVLTVVDAGLYVLDVLGNGFKNATATLGFRAQVGGVTVAAASMSVNSASQTGICHLHAPIALGAGAQVTIQYCAGAAFGVYSGAGLNGEAARTATISLYRVS
jgi:hypothetical protein